MDVDVEVDVDRYFGRFNGGSKSVQVLCNGTKAPKASKSPLERNSP